MDTCSTLAVGCTFGFAANAQQKLSAPPISIKQSTSPGTFRGENKLNRILKEAEAEKWRVLPIGELMGKIAAELEGTPYVSGTLELSADNEICSANLDALDCVTFVETTLALARMIKKGGRTPADFWPRFS